MNIKERALALIRSRTLNDRQVLDKLADEGLAATIDQVFRWRTQAGIPALRKDRQQVSPEVLADIRRLYVETKSFKAVARGIHKCPRDVAFILRRAGDVPAKNGEANG
jgi:hypothetical protein